METQPSTPTATQAATPQTPSPLDKVYKFDDLALEDGSDEPVAEPTDTPEDATDQTPPEETETPESTDEPTEGDEPGETEPTDDTPDGEDAPVEPPAGEPEVDADLKPFLKQMSKQASAAVLKKLQAGKAEVERIAAERDSLTDKLQQFEGKKLPDSWYNDPNAFRATPQYQEAEQKFNQAKQTTDYWSETLAAYENGEVRYDPASNKFIPNDPENPTPVNARIKRHIEDQRLQAYESQKEHANAANEIRSNFTSRYKSASEKVLTETHKLFPYAKDDKSPLHKPYKDILSQVPQEFRDHPVAQLAASLGVRVLQYQAALDAEKKKNTTRQAVKLDQRKAPPIPGKKSRPSASGDKVWTDAELADL
jgi:hypothetical protein